MDDIKTDKWETKQERQMCEGEESEVRQIERDWKRERKSEIYIRRERDT